MKQNETYTKINILLIQLKLSGVLWYCRYTDIRQNIEERRSTSNKRSKRRLQTYKEQYFSNT